MSYQYLYLKLLLRHSLLLGPDEYSLNHTATQGLVCNFLGMQLASAYQPVMRADGKITGREALLRARMFEHGALTAGAAFERAVTMNRLVQFDRLVRTIHLLGHARSFADHELLFLKVHPRLLSSVSNHGRTFEQILHYYSVPTSRVVIEIGGQAAEGGGYVEEAVRNYRGLGYRIAVGVPGAMRAGMERVFRLWPDFVKLDAGSIGTIQDSRNATSLFGGLVDELHDAGIQVAVEKIETARQLDIARRSGADLLQGNFLARPEFATNARGQLCRGEQLAA